MGLALALAAFAFLALSKRAPTVVKPPPQEQPTEEGGQTVLDTATDVIQGFEVLIPAVAGTYAALSGGTSAASTLGSGAANPEAGAVAATGSGQGLAAAGAIMLVVIYAVVVIAMADLFSEQSPASGKADYDKVFMGAYGTATEKAVEAGMTANEALTFAVPFADGFAREVNRQRLRYYMTVNDPIKALLSLQDRANGGVNTGKYIGTPNSTGTGFAVEPPAMSETDAGYQAIAATVVKSSLVRPGATSNPGAEAREALRLKHMRFGEIAANHAGYAAWLSRTPGWGQNSQGHVEDGIRRGAFKGTTDRWGNLTTTVIGKDGTLTSGTLYAVEWKQP